MNPIYCLGPNAICNSVSSADFATDLMIFTAFFIGIS